jgi:transcriptional regulator with XRE-family HTH domain
MCKKKGLRQQALADAFGMKRGKVAGYFYETQPKPDFYERLGEEFQLDIGKFLTAFDLLLKLKRSSDEEERNNLIDELILIHGRTLDEISSLKDDNNELKDQLLKSFRS